MSSSLDCRDYASAEPDEPTPSDRRYRSPARALLSLPVAGAGAAAGVARAHGFAPHQLIVKLDGQRLAREPWRCRARVGVREARGRAARAARGRLRGAQLHRHRLGCDEPARRSPTIPARSPDRPGPPGGWVTKQWNFLPWEGEATPLLPISPGGIDAVGAWEHLDRGRAPGRRGRHGRRPRHRASPTGRRGTRFRRSPDFTAGQFVKGYDFVDDDRLPLDENGHGTHVAGTIAEKTNNGIGLTGLAYRAKLMPVRVLDRHGRGRADDIAKGIRFAVANGADVINMSFNFGCDKQVPGVDEALRQAYRRGVVTVASVGNLGSEACVSPPATGPHVIGVGGSTEGGCLGNYSLAGKDVDVVAPGGGRRSPAAPRSRPARSTR